VPARREEALPQGAGAATEASWDLPAWALICARNPDGGALLVYRAPNEQGFMVETHGDTSRTVFDSEGMLLVRKPLEDAVRPAAPPRPAAAPRVRRRRQST
jgi:hypothetical protein